MRKTYLSRAFISLFAQNFLVFAIFNLLSVFPDHLAGLGASKTYIGLFINLNSLALVLLVIPLSRHTDRIGRKRLLIAGYLGTLVFAAGSFVFADSPAWLLLFRIPGVLLFCAVFTVQGAEAFNLFPRERRLSGVAVYGVSGLVANPVGVLIGEAILRTAHPRWIFAVIFGFTLLGLVLARRYPFREGEADSPRLSVVALARRPPLRPLMILAFTLGGAFSVFSSFLANLTRERFGMVTISPFYIAFSVIAVLVRVFLGSQVERIPPRKLMPLGFALIALAYLQTYFLRNPLLLALVGAVYGLGHAVLFPLLSTLFINSGPDRERLGLNNLFAATNTLGSILSALIMGAVADLLGLDVVFPLMALLAAC